MKSWGHLNPKVIRKQVCTNLGAGVDVGLLRAAVSRQLRRISTDDVGDALFHIFPGSKKKYEDFTVRFANNFAKDLVVKVASEKENIHF